MDENIIFKPGSNQSPNTPSSEPISQAPVTPVTPVSPSSDVPPPPNPPLAKPPRPSILPKIAKIGGLILALLVVLFLIVRFVFPLFGEKKPEKVTLSYWGLWEDKGAMQSIINDFQKENPHITIEYTKKDIKKYRESLATQLTAGTGPDIYRFHNSWVGMMQSFLSPLSNDVITPDEFKNTYFPVVTRDLTRNGGIYGIPLNFDSLSLFINTELFEANGSSIPKTWDEFVIVSKELTVKDDANTIRTAGAAMGTYDNITHAPDVIALLMAQNGTDFSNFSKTQENASQALEFYLAFAKNEGSVWSATLDPSIIAFAKGNLAMYFGYSWDIFTINELNPELKYQVSIVPSLPGRPMTIASYWVEGVSSKSKYQKEAMSFMKFLTRREIAQKFYTEVAKTRKFGELYPRPDLAQTLAGNPEIYPFVSQGDTAVSSYFASDTYDDGINSQMNTYLGNVVRGVQGSTSLQTAVETLAQGVAQVLSKYGR